MSVPRAIIPGGPYGCQGTGGRGGAADRAPNSDKRLGFPVREHRETQAYKHLACEHAGVRAFAASGSELNAHSV